MRVKPRLKHCFQPAVYGLTVWVLALALPGQAATTNVNVSSASNALKFSPSAVTVNAGDQVTWTWAGSLPHSTTDTGVWDSGIKSGSGNSFGVTFATAGSYPYFCSVHVSLGMTGSVTVQAVNVPPSVSITSPTNETVFAAPWTGAIEATASDSDGTVSKVDFFAGATHLGTVNNPSGTPSFTVTNLAAGNYTLTAVATDNLGATNTSTGVGISVVTPVAIVLSAPQRLSASAFQFSYSANPGLSYVVFRSAALPELTPINTNRATGNPVTFLDNGGTGAVNFYDVRLVPNP